MAVGHTLCQLRFYGIDLHEEYEHVFIIGGKCTAVKVCYKIDRKFHYWCMKHTTSLVMKPLKFCLFNSIMSIMSYLYSSCN